MESFGNDVQATLDAAESGETPNSQYMEVTWQSYWNDSLLSLSIRVLGWTSDLIDYCVVIRSRTTLSNLERPILY